MAAVSHRLFDKIDGKIFFHTSPFGSTYEISVEEEKKLKALLKTHSKQQLLGLFFLLALPLVFLILAINFFLENIPVIISLLVLIMVSGIVGTFYFIKTRQKLNKEFEKFFQHKMPCNFKERTGKSLTSARLSQASWVTLTGLILFGGIMFFYGLYTLSQTPFEDLPFKQQYQIPLIVLLGGLILGFASFEAARRK